jgi:hypothetical protein
MGYMGKAISILYYIAANKGFKGVKSDASSADSRADTTEDTLMNDKLNPKIVERWISTTLEDAKYLELPGKYLNSLIYRLNHNPKLQRPISKT